MRQILQALPRAAQRVVVAQQAQRIEEQFWYQKAAHQGNAIAQADLGTCYLHCSGVATDGKKAIEWLRKAAGQGHVEAQEILKKF